MFTAIPILQGNKRRKSHNLIIISISNARSLPVGSYNKPALEFWAETNRK